MSERDNKFAYEYQEAENNTTDALPILSSEELKYHLSFGASPFAGIEHPEVQRSQNHIVRPLLLQRVEQSAPANTPDSLRQFMEQSFLTRFTGRAMRNYEAYCERLEKTPAELISPEFNDVHDRAMRGLASPSELLIVREVLKMKSIELARLTHPYGAKINELDPMRHSVAMAIRRFGGVVFQPDECQDQLKLRSTDLLMNPERKDEAMGLLMTRRRMIGMLEDDTAIMERSSFVVPIYQGSQFDPELSRRMRAVPLIENKDRMAQLEDAGQLSDVVPGLLKNNNFSAAIPLSTTIFAYNRTTATEIKEYKLAHGNLSTRDVIVAMTKKERFYKPSDLESITDRYNEENQH